MSTLTYLTSLVQQAISRLNNYEANAKKVDELPHQATLEPTSKIPVSRAGISEHLTVQQIISSIQNSNYNQLLAVGAITVDGTDIIIPSGVSGKINGLLYGTSTDTILSITLCPTGFSRKDIIVLTTANTIVVISGEETDGAIVLAPTVPTDALYITEFDVNDTAIGIPVDPIVGNRFVEKTDFNPYNSNVTGTDAIIPLDPNGYSEIRLTNTGLISIAGYDLSLILGNANAKSPYPGKPFIILNITGHDVVIKKELPAADYPFYFSEESDLVFPNNHYIYASFDPSGFRVIFKSWIDVDLSTKADLVGGKVPSSQLPSYAVNDITGLQTALDGKQNLLSSFDESILIENNGNIEGNVSLFEEYFEQQECELNFTPIQIIGVYLNGIKQKPSLYTIIPPKTISVTNFVTNDYIEIQYTKLKI